MALRMGALYDALLDAHITPDKARAAAEEVANYERSIADIRADLAVLKWMVGAILGGVLTLLFKAFS